MAELILKNKENDLFNGVLLEPARDCDELCVVSGFATPAMIEHHLGAIEKDIKINLIVGMTPLDGISEANHRNFQKVMKRRSLVKCSYINADADPVHSKLYVWRKNGAPVRAFTSSANYTINAFLRNQDEIASECDATEAYAYYRNKTGFSIYCTEQEVEDFVRKEESFLRESAQKELNSQADVDCAYAPRGQGASDIKLLPLFSEKNDDIHQRAGLNWGQRDGREPNQAYIPVPTEVAKSGFFPSRGQEFSVITNDGFSCICVIAQDNAKAIETRYDNSELGRYFRHKLGLEEGAFVKLTDLDKFGNRYVKFIKINDEEYIMDFSPDR